MVQTISERELLMREVHHRVKNNLQIISSLINLQAINSDKKTKKEIIKDSQDRIMSIALLHEEFYNSFDLKNIDIKNYTLSIINNLLKENKTISSNIFLKNFEFSFDTLVPYGLILTEIFSFTFNQSVKRKMPLQFELYGKKQEKYYEFTVTILSNKMDLTYFSANDSIGYKLINGLAQQMHAKIDNFRTGKNSLNLYIPINK